MYEADELSEYWYYNSFGEMAPCLFVWLLIIVIYYVLKLRDNTFVNKHESIILLYMFVVVPILMGIIFLIFNFT